MKNNKKYCKLPCSACSRHFSFILGGDGVSTQTGCKKVSIVVEDLKTLTAYQVYNDFNQKKNQKRYVTDITKEDFVQLFIPQSKFVPTIILEYNDSFNPYFTGKITGATLNKDGKLVLEISSRGFSMKSKFKDCIYAKEVGDQWIVYPWEREDSEAIPDYLKEVEHLRDSHYIGGLTMPGGAKTSWWKKIKDNE